MKIIGVTGGVGSGKSQILQAIESRYTCRVLLADDIANRLKEPGQPCYGPMLDLFGADVLEEDGTISKRILAEKIFQDQSLLTQVNAIIHPAVRRYIEAEIEKERERNRLDFIFVEAALLIEAGYGDMMDSLWYIYAEESVRVERLIKGRGYSTEKIRSIMKKQLQEEVFRTACQVIIDNSGDFEDTMKQVVKELDKLHETM